MTKNQPFLSGFPTLLCGSIRRRLQDVIAAKRRALADSSIATYAMQFSHVLPAEFLHGLSVSKRIRQYCNVTVFWAWLAQILEANASLSKGVSLIHAWCKDAGLPAPGMDTGAYSKGRGRLPVEFLEAVNQQVNELMFSQREPGVQTLRRLHQSRHRKLDWRQGKRIGRNQRLITWKKPAQQPSGSTI